MIGNEVENAVYFQNSLEWRKWLQENHNRKKEVWVLLYKKHTGKVSLSYKEGVEEALCFGWIDGKMKRIDDEKHIQRFSPRTDKSIWSKINKDLAIKLIKDGRMTKAGLQKIEIAKKNGNWQAAYTSLQGLSVPSDLKKSLLENKIAWKNFQNFANSYRNIFIGWIESAKTKETRNKRIEVVTEKSLNNIKMLI